MLDPSANTHSGLNSAPIPADPPPRWKEVIGSWVREDPYLRWGPQLARVASDMILVCDEDLEILFHNHSFLKGVGYQEGSFVGQSLLSFFPAEDRATADGAFAGFRKGHAAGMRIAASVLTRRMTRQFDMRVVRSRKQDGSYFYYLIARDETGRAKETVTVQAAAEPTRSFFDSLPVAVWRTDRELRITEAEGSLWEDLGIESDSLIGVSFGEPDRDSIPGIFDGVDFCDSMAGLSFHVDIEYEEAPFDISVEPVLNPKNRVIGTIGILRRSKKFVPDRVEQQLEIERQAIPPVDESKLVSPSAKTEPVVLKEVIPKAIPLPVSAETETVPVSVRPLGSNLAGDDGRTFHERMQSLNSQVKIPRPMTPPPNGSGRIGSEHETADVMLPG